MGRKQLWDQAEVLASAMRLFRRRGYLGSSLRDIEEATGLHPGSLYRVFQSKDGLFCAALDAYNDQVVQGRVRAHLLEPADPVAGIRSFFTSTFETGLDPDPGCLLTNSAVESFAVPQAAEGSAGAGDDRVRLRRSPDACPRPGPAVRGSGRRGLGGPPAGALSGPAGAGPGRHPLTKLHTITDGAMASIGPEKEGQR